MGLGWIFDEDKFVDFYDNSNLNIVCGEKVYYG